jgi:hypothetical protein
MLTVIASDRVRCFEGYIVRLSVLLALKFPLSFISLIQSSGNMFTS